MMRYYKNCYNSVMAVHQDYTFLSQHSCETIAQQYNKYLRKTNAIQKRQAYLYQVHPAHVLRAVRLDPLLNNNCYYRGHLHCYLSCLPTRIK